jgi:hypothetical protein
VGAAWRGGVTRLVLRGNVGAAAREFLFTERVE